MKKLIYTIFAAVVVCNSLSSCSEDKLNPESIITVDEMKPNDFDKWLEVNYMNPYNILFKYRYEMNESDYNYYTVPADYNSSIMLAHLVKHLCIDSYDECAGVQFTRKYFPKMFFLIGEWEYKNNGTFILGTAEGGKKILLSGVNYLTRVLNGTWGDYRSNPAGGLNHYYIKTIHHEFTHILNQTKDFPADFTQITPSNYITDSWSTSEYGSYYRQRGFISAYSQHSDREDFAELMSLYVTNTPEAWNAWIAEASRTVTEDDVNEDKSTYPEFRSSFPTLGIGSKFPGGDYIKAKIEIVKTYMLNTFNIKLDDLRDAVLRRQDEVMSGQVDLTSLEIN